MQAFHSDRFEPVLPEGHRFPMAKYRLLHERVARGLPGVRLSEAPSVSDAQLCLVHEPAYVAAVVRGELDAAQQREIGFPWSGALVERSRRSVGATLAATEAALREGVALNLAGGTHHAAAGQGGGFCVFNDVAVAVRWAQAQGWLRRALVVDLDVHQGNGTAAVFQGDDSVFTLSLHGDKNFPFRKVAGSLDVALPDGCDDAAYLHALGEALAVVVRAHERQPFDALFYLAGADAHEGDRLGRLGVSAAGMRRRDDTVMRFSESRGLPLVMAMAGGYGRDLEAMLDVQFASVEAAWQSWWRRRPGS
ncbi:MAG: histone deacetylase [Proteobacteria bacterium]|uniref:histone deacetylase n=1 Tax=Aquabacterium sp. TaxID=1872578 RepID=UPI0035C6D437|nr:histone deacetylase [Pseudomonadota bacterium]